MNTIPAIDQAERLIHKLAGRGITLSLVDGGTAAWAAPATSLRPQDRQALRELKPVLSPSCLAPVTAPCAATFYGSGPPCWECPSSL